ncbi:pyocin activator PrtN family protein [Acinetobacter pittii]|uniref:pyocin activator PrtN family protein n=2 Tax=Acinetobacter calcoaceticus/baumannii complex TaxID=909768 RepID=UPI002A761E6C|nr:pyocin activator PrtN family protein [Acinetobacter pittii]WPP98056.1 pyocin activator PrtN family protein [Acinetobacter pittii]
MGAFQLNTADYLFMKYRSMTVELMSVVQDYYPHLSKAEALRKANNQEFPFSVFKIDSSKRAPFLVHVKDLADIEPYRVCRRVNILRDYPDDKTKLYPRN